MGKIDASELKDLLNDTTRKMKSAEDNIQLNTLIENLIVSVMDSEFASLWIFDEEKIVLLRERSNESVREISMLDQRGVLAKCFLTLTGGIYNYLASEKEYRPETDNPDKIRMKSKIIVPLVDGERLLGLATAYSSVQNIKSFDEDDMELFEAITPFLINVVYRINPKMKEKNLEKNEYISERLLDDSQAVVKKVEEIQKSQQSVETSDATLSFLSNTVHDIRTPANTLYGFLELLEGQLDNPRLLQYIQNAKESAQFINDLTTSILDRVSSQRERTKAVAVPISPTKFFADIAEIFSANMSNKKIGFNVYIDPLVPNEILVEDMLLKRVIMNLISNAYKFTPSKKTIEVIVQYKPSTQHLHISIKDTGIGIAKEKQDEIFKAFKQAEDNTALHYGGTGLGLNISAQYVKDLGAELKLESELDVGSTFYFNIPVKVTNKKVTFEPMKNKNISLGILLDNDNIFTGKNIMRYLIKMGIDKENVSPTNDLSKLSLKTTHLICFQNQFNNDVLTFTQDNKIELLIVEEVFLSLIEKEVENKFSIISQYGYYANTLHTFINNKSQMKILIVDDDKINLNLIMAMIEEEFCHIDTAINGEVALSMLKDAAKNKDPYTLVYIDNYMPIMTGIEAMTQFRSYEKQNNIHPIYAVNISGDPRANTDDSLFNAYIAKPFKKSHIKTALEEAISKR